MNPVERLLHEEITHFLDRLASSVPSDGVTSHAMTPAVRTRLDEAETQLAQARDRKSTRLNSSHVSISYAVFCLKKKKAREVLHQCRDSPDLRLDAARQPFAPPREVRVRRLRALHRGLAPLRLGVPGLRVRHDAS